MGVVATLAARHIATRRKTRQADKIQRKPDKHSDRTSHAGDSNPPSHGGDVRILWDQPIIAHTTGASGPKPLDKANASADDGWDQHLLTREDSQSGSTQHIVAAVAPVTWAPQHDSNPAVKTVAEPAQPRSTPRQRLPEASPGRETVQTVIKRGTTAAEVNATSNRHTNPAPARHFLDHDSMSDDDYADHQPHSEESLERRPLHFDFDGNSLSYPSTPRAATPHNRYGHGGSPRPDGAEQAPSNAGVPLQVMVQHGLQDCTDTTVVGLEAIVQQEKQRRETKKVLVDTIKTVSCCTRLF